MMTDDEMVDVNAPEWDGMSDTRRTAIVLGAEVARAQRAGINQALENAFLIGHALHELQLEAMERSHSVNPSGGGYNKAYALLEKPAPELAFTRSDRNQYIWCWLHREEVTRWWARVGELEEKQRLATPNSERARTNRRSKINHPAVIHRNYEKDNAPPKGEADPDKPPSPSAKKDAEILRLVEENDKLERDIRRLKRDHSDVTEGRDWSWTDEVEDIARVWMTINPTKVVRIASKIMEWSKARSKKPTKKPVKVSRGVLLNPERPEAQNVPA